MIRLQANFATDLLDACRLDQTFIVDGVGKHIFGGLARQDHLPAIGDDTACIVNTVLSRLVGLQQPFLYLEIDQAIAIEIDNGLARTAQRDMAITGDDVAMVCNL